MKTTFWKIVPTLIISSYAGLVANEQPPPPGPPIDPAEYEALLELPAPVMPPVILTPAEEKMSSQLSSLSNPGLWLPGQTAVEIKAQMLTLGQIRHGVPGTISDLLYIYVYAVPGLPLAAVIPEFFEAPDISPDGNLLAGWIEETKLQGVALMPEVRFIQSVHRPRFRSGLVTTAGDALHNGHAARSTYSVDGSPIRVGVISNGVVTAAGAQMTNDLPPVLDIVNSNAGFGDEGTAMLEIIHDIAPGSPLSFAASGTNVAAFQNALTALVAGSGCQVVCDDVGWYTDPYFEHSSTAQHITNLKALHDFVHVSAAGNDAYIHHQQFFTDVKPTGAPDGNHDGILLVEMPPGSVLEVFLKWDEPMALIPVNDYDLYLRDVTPTTLPMTILAQSLTRNAVGEWLQYTNNTGSHIRVGVYVQQFSGPHSRELEIFLEPQSGSWPLSNNISAVDSIFGHPGSPDVIAVTATDVSNPNVIEPYCSQGPFTTIGVITPPFKPDVAAADGVAVTGVGGFGSPFWGTSAAAPHVAGICALAWHRSPMLTANDIMAALPPAGCIDLPTTAPDGPEMVFGYGRPLADLWAAALNLPPTVTAPSGPVTCVQMIPEEVTGVSISDPDAGSGNMTVTFTVSVGIIMVDDAVGGGVMPHEVTGNHTQSVTLTASMAAINTTLASPLGLSYNANPVPPGTPPPPPAPTPDTLTILVNDHGNGGVGGSGPLTDTAITSLNVHEFGYYRWLYGKFNPTELGDPSISGDQGDPDQDRYTNIWEFFMGTDPKLPDAPGEMSHSTDGTNFVFRFRIDSSINPAWYRVRASQDLTNWTDVPSGQITVPWPNHPTTPGAFLMEIKRPLSANARDFMRIEFQPYQP